MPMKNSIKPKILRNRSLYSNKRLPTLDAAAPSRQKAMEKPAVKNRELITAFFVAALWSPVESSFAEKPDIKDK